MKSSRKVDGEGGGTGERGEWEIVRREVRARRVLAPECLAPRFWWCRVWSRWTTWTVRRLVLLASPEVP